MDFHPCQMLRSTFRERPRGRAAVVALVHSRKLKNAEAELSGSPARPAGMSIFFFA